MVNLLPAGVALFKKLHCSRLSNPRCAASWTSAAPLSRHSGSRAPPRGRLCTVVHCVHSPRTASICAVRSVKPKCECWPSVEVNLRPPRIPVLGKLVWVMAGCWCIREGETGLNVQKSLGAVAKDQGKELFCLWNEVPKQRTTKNKSCKTIYRTIMTQWERFLYVKILLSFLEKK